MALIDCPECGNRVSDKAEKCPSCGYSIVEYLENTKRQEEERKREEPKIKQREKHIAEEKEKLKSE